ncbi:hypothetical protein [Methylobacterium indicum]|uniref:hypothetical protein n=1 Tax=Methylobacterium indicum TaxID=1775910 RepID=UPI000A89C7AB|nr:hypothetical protein [Methylobacterium indicum]
MIDRKFLAVSALLILLSGFACAQAQGNDQHSNNQQQNTQSEEKKPGSFQTGIVVQSVQTKTADQGTAQTKIYEPDCGKPKDQPEADLCTQRRVANAAEEALQYNLAQTVIGALGVAFVVVTLGFTARANKAAAIAAQAAMDAVGAERAWLSFMNINIAPTRNTEIYGKIHEETITFNIAWINSGRSPAINVNTSIISSVLDLDAKLPHKDLEAPSTGGVVGPGISVLSPEVAIYGNDLALFKQRKKKFVIWSKATYETTYHKGIVRQTECCVEIIFNGMKAKDDGSFEPRFMIMQAGYFNTAS